VGQLALFAGGVVKIAQLGVPEGLPQAETLLLLLAVDDAVDARPPDVHSARGGAPASCSHPLPSDLIGHAEAGAWQAGGHEIAREAAAPEPGRHLQGSELARQLEVGPKLAPGPGDLPLEVAPP